jgi:hypothetical protein
VTESSPLGQTTHAPMATPGREDDRSRGHGPRTPSAMRHTAQAGVAARVQAALQHAVQAALQHAVRVGCGTRPDHVAAPDQAGGRAVDRPPLASDSALGAQGPASSRRAPAGFRAGRRRLLTDTSALRGHRHRRPPAPQAHHTSTATHRGHPHRRPPAQRTHHTSTATLWAPLRECTTLAPPPRHPTHERRDSDQTAPSSQHGAARRQERTQAAQRRSKVLPTLTRRHRRAGGGRDGGRTSPSRDQRTRQRQPGHTPEAAGAALGRAQEAGAVFASGPPHAPQPQMGAGMRWSGGLGVHPSHLPPLRPKMLRAHVCGARRPRRYTPRAYHPTLARRRRGGEADLSARTHRPQARRRV